MERKSRLEEIEYSDSVPPESALDGMDSDLAELVDSALEELKENDLASFVESFNLISFTLPSQDKGMVTGLYSSFVDEAKSRGLSLAPLSSMSCPFALAQDEDEFTLLMKEDLRVGKGPDSFAPASMAPLNVTSSMAIPGADELKWLSEAKRVYYGGLESFKSAASTVDIEQKKQGLLGAIADFELALAYFPQSAYLEREEKVLREEIGFDYVRCCNMLSRADPASSKNCSLKSEGVVRTLSFFDLLILWALDKLGR